MNRYLVLFTSSFPYEGGEQFLETEIEFLARTFEKITVVPARKRGRIRAIPQNVSVDDSVADTPKTVGARAKYLLTPLFLKGLSRNMKENKYLAICMLYIARDGQWIRSYVNKHSEHDLNATLFYCYWFGAATIALHLAKLGNSRIKYVTRAHRGDLYEGVNGFDRFPFRQEVLSNIDRVYCISHHGKTHLESRYEVKNECVQVSPLGVYGGEVLNERSNDNVFRILSCSSFAPVKRVPLLLDAVSLMPEEYKLQWTHIGGPADAMEQFQKEANKRVPENVEVRFLGQVSNSLVRDYYHKNPVDLFVNVSESEGVPVSIMEAQSFGVPVMATEVGGTGEIVSQENGILIPVEVTAQEIANILVECASGKVDIQEKRAKAVANWREYYNANKNYTSFCLDLARL